MSKAKPVKVEWRLSPAARATPTTRKWLGKWRRMGRYEKHRDAVQAVRSMQHKYDDYEYRIVPPGVTK